MPCQLGVLPARVCAVISNKADAYGLERARLAGVPAIAHWFRKARSAPSMTGSWPAW